MRGPVVAGEPCAIHAEEYGQLLQSHVVNDGIEGALQEGRVDSTDGPEAARGQAGGEGHRMLLGDAHIEVAFGVMRTEEIEAGATGHGCRDGHNALVLVG